MKTECITVQVTNNKYVIIICLLSIIRSVNVQFAMPLPMYAPPPPPMIAIPARPQIQVAVMPVAIPDFEKDDDETNSTTTTKKKLRSKNKHKHKYYMAINFSLPKTNWAPPLPIMLVPRYPRKISCSDSKEKEEESCSSETQSSSSSKDSTSSDSGSSSGSYSYKRRSRKDSKRRNGRKLRRLRRLSRQRLHKSRRAMSRDKASIRPMLSFVDRHGDIKASKKLHRADLAELMGFNRNRVVRNNDKQDIKEKRRNLQQSVQRVKDQTDNTLKNMALISDFAQKIKQIKAHNPLPMRRQMGPQETLQRNMAKIFHPEDNKVTNLSVSFHK